MKKVFLFASAAIAALAVVSCNKEIETPESLAGEVCPEGYYVEELEATYPVDPATRTAFNEDSGKFAWTEGDELAFHLSNGTYTSAPIDPATSKVKLYLPVGVTRDNYAVYPASAVVEEAATVGNMQVTLPSTYDISGNLETEFVPMPLIATNDADNKKLKFEHVGGLLQVNLNVPAGVKTAKLSMGKTITGTFDLVSGSGNGVIEAGEASDDALTFVLSEEGLAAETSVKLLAPLPTGTYENFDIVFSDGNDDNYKFEKDLSANPWDFARSGGKKVSINESSFDNIAPDYFWFEALSSYSRVYVYKGQSSGFYYSIDNKKTWIPIESDSQTTINLNKVGDRVYFYGTVGKISTLSYSERIFNGSGKLAAGGDIMTLLLKTGATLYSSVFYNLFNNNSALVDASEIVFPDYTESNCYNSMFNKCENLSVAPVILPAENVKQMAYSNMFYWCTSLVVPPIISAKKASTQSCYNMFYYCKSLTEAPDLLIDEFVSFDGELVQHCLGGMFGSCSSLTKATNLIAKDVPMSAYSEMYANCISLVNPPEIAVEHVGTGALSGMFLNCKSLTSIPEMSNIIDAANSTSGGAFYRMFSGCTGLVDLSDYSLVLPHIADGAYGDMFKGCTSLTKAPKILATSAGMRSCASMFNGCTSLVEAPELRGITNLGSQCFQSMFEGCTSLVEMPALPVSNLKSWCYVKMFKGCTSLLEAYLPSTLSGGGYSSTEAYFQMFKDCTGLRKVELFGTPGCQGMFEGCTNLSVIITHFKEWKQNTSSYNTKSTYKPDIFYECCHWVSNVSETGAFYKVSELPCSVDENGIAIEGDYTGQDFIPLGWKVYNLQDVNAGI